MSTARVNTIIDSGGGNTTTVNGVTIALSSQAQAQGFTDNSTQMTPLRNLQAGVGAPHFVLEDQKASGTNGQTIASAGTWTVRDLNTEVRDVLNIVSITSNQFTVTADCWVEWQVMGRDQHMTRLWNVTNSVSVATSLSSGPQANAISTGCGLCLAGKTYQMEVNTAVAGQIHVVAAGRGVPEVYTRIRGWRAS